MKISDGIIELDSKFGKELGFTSDKFDGWLWKKDGDIWISFIQSKKEGKGNLSRLFDAISKRGYKIKVPTPMGKMRLILVKKGFKPTVEFVEEIKEPVEVWIK